MILAPNTKQEAVQELINKVFTSKQKEEEISEAQIIDDIEAINNNSMYTGIIDFNSIYVSTENLLHPQVPLLRYLETIEYRILTDFCASFRGTVRRNNYNSLFSMHRSDDYGMRPPQALLPEQVDVRQDQDIDRLQQLLDGDLKEELQGIIETVRVPKDLSEVEVSQPPITGAVLEGGGAKGLVYIGVTKELGRLGVYDQLEYVAGSSAGAMNAFAMAMGLSADQLVKFLEDFNIIDLLDPKPSDEFKKVSQCAGKNIHSLFEFFVELSLGDPHASFADLEAQIQACEDRGIKSPLKKLYVTMTDTNFKNPTIFVSGDSNDTIKDDLNNVYNVKDLRIADVVRASMSIPPAFGPINVRLKDGTAIGYYRDGGITNNFPTEILQGKDKVKRGYCTRQEKGITINPSCLALKLKKDIDQLNPSKTRFSEFIKRERLSHGLESDPSKTSKEDLQVEETTSRDYYFGLGTGIMDLASVVLQSQGYVGGTPSNNKSKYETSMNILELYTAGVNTFDFGVSTTPEFQKAIKSGDIATRMWFEQHRSTDTPVDFQSVNYDRKHLIDDEALTSHFKSRNPVYIKGLFDDYLSEFVKCEAGKPSVRLLQLASYIKFVESTIDDKMIVSKELTDATERLRNSRIAKLEHHHKLDLIINRPSYINRLVHLLEDKAPEGEDKVLFKSKNEASFKRQFHTLMSDCLYEFSTVIPDKNNLSLPRLAVHLGKVEELKGMLSTIQSSIYMNEWWVNRATIKQVVSPDKGLTMGLDKNGHRMRTYAQFLNEQPLIHDCIQALSKADNADQDQAKEITACLTLLLDEQGIDLLRKDDDHYLGYISVFHHLVDEMLINDERGNIYTALNSMLTKLVQSDCMSKIDLTTHIFADGKTLLQHFASQSKYENSIDHIKGILVQQDIKADDTLSLEGLTFMQYQMNSESGVELPALQYDKEMVDLDFRRYMLTPDEHGLLPLHAAAIDGDMKLFNELINKTQKIFGKQAINVIELKSSQWLGCSALYLAAQHGHDGIVNILRALGATVNNAGPLSCPSAFTVASHYPKCISSMLLTGPKDFSRIVPNEHGEEILHLLTNKAVTTEDDNIAIYDILSHYGRSEIVYSSEYVLQRLTKACDANGKTPLHNIIDSNNMPLLKFLCEKGMPSYNVTHDRRWYLDTYFDLDSMVNGQTPIEYALSCNPPRTELVMLMADNCYDIGTKRRIHASLLKHELQEAERLTSTSLVQVDSLDDKNQLSPKALVLLKHVRETLTDYISLGKRFGWNKKASELLENLKDESKLNDDILEGKLQLFANSLISSTSKKIMQQNSYTESLIGLVVDSGSTLKESIDSLLYEYRQQQDVLLIDRAVDLASDIEDAELLVDVRDIMAAYIIEKKGGGWSQQVIAFQERLQRLEALGFPEKSVKDEVMAFAGTLVSMYSWVGSGSALKTSLEKCVEQHEASSNLNQTNKLKY